MKKYKVIRMHYGDKMYREGDERECDEIAAKQLIASRLIEEIGSESQKDETKDETKPSQPPKPKTK